MSRGSRSLLAHSIIPQPRLVFTAKGTLHHKILAKVTGSVDKLSSQTWYLLLETTVSGVSVPKWLPMLLWLRMALAPALDCLPGLGRTGEHDHGGTTLSGDGNNISGAGTKPFMRNPPWTIAARSKPHGCLASLVL